MKTIIYPDRKGSRAARGARSAAAFLGAFCAVAAVLAFVDGFLADYLPTLIGAAVALFLLAALFRVLGCIAYDLETIAATKEVDYIEDGDDTD